jgi:SnoaL-like domain
MNESTMFVAWACEQSLRRLFHGLDTADYALVVDGFAVGGVWHRRGSALTGREAILGAMHARPATHRVHHVITNFLVQHGSNATLDAAFIMTAYRHPVAARGAPTPRLSEPPALFRGTVALVHEDAAWRVRSLDYERACDLGV